MKLPWGKREIVNAVIAVYRPVDPDDLSTHAGPQCLGAFASLALGRTSGRAPPHIEDALNARIVRVWTAINEGRDPNAAYEVPLEDERPLSTDDQLSRGYREMAKLLDKFDAERRNRRQTFDDE